MKQPMDGKVLISAFINGLLQSAKIAALTDLLMQDEPNSSWTKQERYDAYLVKHLGLVADQIAEAAVAPRIAIAQPFVGHG